MSAIVTGWGTVSALGASTAELRVALAEGRSGIGVVQRFDTSVFQTHLGAFVPGYESRRDEGSELAIEFAIRAIHEALEHAGLELTEVCSPRFGLVLGTSLGDARMPHRLTERVASALGMTGPRLTISTACTSSTHAIGLARDWVERGFVDRCLGGGADALTLAMFGGFHALGVLSKNPCAPFSTELGTTLGEGAGFLVFEGDSATTEPRARILGYGLSGDAYHETAPDPRGVGVQLAIERALADAHVAPDAIGFVNAHGTGTASNDPAEWCAIESAFGEHARSLPVSSTKGSLGHAQGAAGVLELVATLECLAEGTIPPTRGLTQKRPRSPHDPVPGDLPRRADVQTAVSTNSAFGGANCAVVVTTRNASGASSPASHDVFVRGLGVLLPFADDASTLVDAKASPGRVALDPATSLPRVDVRGLDRAALFTCVAARRALLDAGLDVRGKDRDHVGLVVGTPWVSPSSAERFQESIDARGAAKPSAAAFARVVLNAAQGSCAKIFGFRGPQTTVTTGDGTGLAALLVGADVLGARDDARHLLVVAAEEHDRELGGSYEGALCVALSHERGAGPAIRVAGYGIAGPGRIDGAIRAASAMAGRDDADERITLDTPSLDGRPRADHRYQGALALPALASVVAAVARMRRGELTRVLVAEPGGSQSTAVFLERLP